jgi:nucleotide-binding universal stress UspA family protein
MTSSAVLCAVDGSRAARDAALVAAGLAEALELGVRLLHVVAPDRPVTVAAAPYHYVRGPENDLSIAAGKRLLEDVAAELPLSRSVERRVDVGDPVTVITGVAENEHAALLVIGTRGRGPLAAAILGSVSAGAVSRSACPVMVVPEGSSLRPGHPIVCAVDDSPAARSATRAALWLSLRLDVELLVVHAIASTPPPSASAAPGVPDRLAELERKEAARFLTRLALEEGLGADVERKLTQGGEAESIRELAEEEDASLVVVGTRRRGSLRSALVGSFSLDVRSNCSRPVVVVPAGARIPIPAGTGRRYPSSSRTAYESA